MTEIIPAILPKDYNEIVEKTALVRGYAKTVQIDVCDNHFVPNFTWPYVGEYGEWQRIVNEEEGLPNWNELDFEIDLMVDEPERVVGDWVQAGAGRIIIHAESKGDIKGAINILDGRVEVGIALGVDTPLSILEQISVDIDKIKLLQFMGIDKIGFQGQRFDNKVIDNIKRAKEKYPRIFISVDGGVSLDNALSLKNAGADHLVVGSAIFEGDDAVNALRALQDIVV